MTHNYLFRYGCLDNMKKLEKTLEYKVKALFFIESALVPFADAVDTKRRRMCYNQFFAC